MTPFLLQLPGLELAEIDDVVNFPIQCAECGIHTAS
jgi:hypothetical protein